MKKTIVAVLILMIVVAIAVVMLTRNQPMSNDEFSTTDMSRSEVVVQEKETSTEYHSQAVYMPTEKEVLDKFNSYIEFADKWIYNYKDNLNELGDYTDSEGNRWAYINDNEYKTAESLKAEVRKYFESGYPVEFIDKARNVNGRICYPIDDGDGRGMDEFDNISVDNLSDGTFEINYYRTAWGPYDPSYNMFNEMLYYRPNSDGEWYFYESDKVLNCKSWESYFKKYLKTYCEDCNAFSLADIDKDGIPEMILYATDTQKDENRMLEYNDNISLMSIYVGVEYLQIENSEKICKIVTDGNDTETIVYSGDGEVLWRGMAREIQGRKTYYSMNQTINLFEYMDLIIEYCPESKRKSLKRYDLNQENLDKYLFEYSE